MVAALRLSPLDTSLKLLAVDCFYRLDHGGLDVESENFFLRCAVAVLQRLFVILFHHGLEIYHVQ